MGETINSKTVFRRLFLDAVAVGDDPSYAQMRERQLRDAGADDAEVERVRALGPRLRNLRAACASRPHRLGLGILATAVAEGLEITTIERIRDWNAEDGVPAGALDAAFECGYATFKARRSATAPSASV